MITLVTEPHICKLVQTVEDLQELPTEFEIVYADCETSSGDPKLASTNPWHNCSLIGWAVTFDDNPCAWFVPAHLSHQWFSSVLSRAKQWVNHNVKYDCHVALNSGESIPEPLQLICTIMESCLVDSDRRFKPGGRSLEGLAVAWLPPEYRKQKELLSRYLKNSKDFGDIPLDILAEYACGDVHVNRALHKHCLDIINEYGCQYLYQNEIAFTRVLLDMERAGLYIDPQQVMIAEYLARGRMINIEKELKELIGYYMNPNSPKQVYDLLCVRYGLPVVKWTDPKKNKSGKSNPSFDKEAMEIYKEDCIDVTEEIEKVILLLCEYKGLSQQCGLFYEPWQTLAKPEGDLGVLHADFNQNVATGRLSCSQPNDQQLNTEAKQQIKPKPGYVFLSFDQSQIEYRVIGNYQQSPIIIEAYAADPDADFHALVQGWCENIPRRPAKTINFLVAFGGGEGLIVAKLSNDFRKMKKGYTPEESKAKAKAVFKKWHAMLPENRLVAKHAERKAKSQGYVKNLAGRRLQISGPIHNKAYDSKGRAIYKCHNALPLAVQSTAADIAKFIAVRLQPLLRRLGVELVALVHDEFLFFVPDNGEDFIIDCARQIRDLLEQSPFTMSVPLRVDGGFSRHNWAACSDNWHCDIDTRQCEGKLPKNFERADLFCDKKYIISMELQKTG